MDVSLAHSKAATQQISSLAPGTTVTSTSSAALPQAGNLISSSTETAFSGAATTQEMLPSGGLAFNTDYLSLFTPIASILLVIIGWNIIYYNAKRIATRNESKSIVDDAVKIIDDIEKTTTEYWLSGRKARIESSIYLILALSKITTLYGRLDILKRRGLDTSSLSMAMLVEHMTLDCEKVDQISDEAKRSQMELFLESSNRFVDNLYLTFEKRYAPANGLLSRLKCVMPNRK
jgi:hypothetical protein